MKVSFSDKDKKENKNILNFLHFYVKSHEEELNVNCVTTDATKSPDYLVDDLTLAIEVKEVHDLVENKEQAQWGTIIHNLQNAIEKNSLFNQVRGSYMINTPPVFKMRRDQKGIELNALAVIQHILNGDKEFEVEGTKFNAVKVSEKDSGIFFGTSKGGSYDPAGTIHQNIFKQIKSANSQLGNSPTGYKRVVLLVNKYRKIHWDWDIFKAFSYMLSDLRSYSNIDEIWFQHELENGNAIHKLVYRKDVFDQLESKSLSKYEDIDQELFANWFSSLETLGEEKKEELLEGLKILLKDKSPDQVFKNPVARGEIARFGIWLVDKGLFKDAVWFVKKFIKDPDPADPTREDKEEQGLTYHNEILLGKSDVYAITSVLGHLAWVIQRLTLHEETLIESFEFTKNLLDHKNLYIKLQALIPLIEITRRREKVKEKDQNVYKELSSLLFKLLNNYSKYPALGKGLVQIFYYYRDLNTENALKVVEELRNSNEVAPFLIYYALFRKRNFKEKGEFDSSPLIRELKSIIRSEDPKLNALRNSILWNFWKLLQSDPDEFKMLKPYIDLFLEIKYNNRSAHTVEYIIEEWMERETDICISWFLFLIKNASEYVGSDPEKGREVWLDTTKTISFISEREPQKLLSAMKDVVNLWNNFAYVGNPKELFESYKNITEPSLKERIKNQFRNWYDEMKELNPKIHEVDWDL